MTVDEYDTLALSPQLQAYDCLGGELYDLEIETVEEKAKIARMMIDRWIAWSGKTGYR